MLNDTLRWLEWLAIATLLAAAFFIAFPDLDLDVSLKFGDVFGFHLSESRVLNLARSGMLWLCNGPIAVVLFISIVSVFVRRARLFNTRALLFILTTYAVVPGILVNGLLKRNSGRARPRNIEEFGGDAVYTPVLRYADQCEINCSFVSAEASALFTVAVLAITVFVPSLPKPMQIPVKMSILVIAIVGSFLRVPFGAHFISDVVFAALFSTMAVMSLYSVFGMHRIGSPFLQANPGMEFEKLCARKHTARHVQRHTMFQ